MPLPPKRARRPEPSSFSYDRERGTYRERATGRYVSRAAVREAIDTAIEREQRDMVRASRRLANGTASIQQWEEQMADSIKSLHLWNGAAGKGGWGEMTAADYGKVGARVREQYGYLDNFALQLESGEASAQSSGFLERVMMYADAGRNTYHSTLLSAMTESGRAEERNVLGEADHCDGCLAADAAGWSPLGTLPLPGERDCLVNCKCDIEYR